MKQTRPRRSCGEVETRKELIKDHFESWMSFVSFPRRSAFGDLKELAGDTGESLSSYF